MSARYMQPLRVFIQFIFLGFMLWLGYRLYLFVQAASAGFANGLLDRPDGIDGFLPISGLLGVSSWIRGGEINSIHPAAVVIFVTIIAVSLLLRRSFCSWICPIATISECFWKTGHRLLRRNPRLPAWIDIALRSLKYLLMVFFVYFIAIAMSPAAQESFINSDYHKVADVRLLYFFMQISTLALVIILSLAALSIVLKNPFCRYLCPYGAMLGLFATLSPLRVTRDPELCVSCGVCSKVCPSNIDVMHKTEVITPECIACWRCISHCRFNEAVSMRAVRRFKVAGFVFAALVVLLFLGGTLIGKLSGHWHSSTPIKDYVRILGK